MNLTQYDWIVINTSAGKDSQAMTDYVVTMADALGVKDKVVMAHADLGRVEWGGTRDLAEEHAKSYGVRFEVVKRGQDLVDQIRARGMFPDSQNRYCTSDHKRDQVAKIITKLAAEKAHLGRRLMILNCMGFRAEESPARAKRVPFSEDKRLTNGKRLVHQWLPIHTWKLADVWARIKASGVRHHWAYDLGMPRLSCCFCVFAPKSALMLAGKHNPELLDTYVELEQQIGHTFRHKFTIESVRDALRNSTQTGPVEDWNM